MDFLTLATDRYSVRKFKPEHVSQDDLDIILHAAQVAPTAHNYQPHRILVLHSDEDAAQLNECDASQGHAPTALLICYDEDECWVRDFDGKKSGEIDAAIVTTQMMYAATDIGVGSVWVMLFDPDKTRKALELPDNYVPVAFLMLGYPADDAKPSPMHSDNLPMEETIFYESF